MEERKEYSIIGKVEIGTDEYRDLIEAVAEANKQYEKERKENSDYYWKVDRLQKQVEEFKAYKEFVYAKCLDSFRLWKLENEEDE